MDKNEVVGTVIPDSMSNLWKRLMLGKTAFRGSYGRLRMLYMLEDPWNMTSAREQHRFRETKRQLSSISDRYGVVLELGCGEGHQTVHLKDLADRYLAADLSPTALERARQRCPDVEYHTCRVETAPETFRDQHFDLITACEVLCYVPDVEGALARLQSKTDRLYVTNYISRAEKMRHFFTGDGWRRLDDIRHDRMSWECYIWESRISGAPPT